MKIEKPIKFFVEALGKDLATKLIPEVRYRTPDMTVELETRTMTDLQMEQLVQHCETVGETRLAARLTSMLNLAVNPEGEPIAKLEKLETALVEYIRKSPHKFVFTEEADGLLVPYYVTGVKYHPRNRDNPAYTQMNLAAVCMDTTDTRTVTWHREDLSGRKMTVVELLNEHGYFLETEKAYNTWLKELEVWQTIWNLTGTQFSAMGMGFGGRWGTSLTAMQRDGRPSRVVMDYKGDEVDEDGNHRSKRAYKESVDGSFWTAKSRIVRNDDDDESEAAVAVLPIHPYVQVFHFEDHSHYTIHVNGLVPYVYNTKLAEKLVLPEDVKELVNILVEGAAETMEDIVTGKTGGVVVIATGDPGTGKTLTAEVYAEHIQRPLYAVQCSQLGTDETALEKKLNQVLLRAGRWKAILLVDEADVYVRTRDNDLQQNAIVGVFLRLLEYYRGVLFLTSNRATMIDDAIMSRAIAHLRYELPDKKSLARIWKILGENYQAGLTDDDVAQLVEALQNISGRNVKTLLKLATAVARKRGTKVTVEQVKQVSKFIDLPRQK